MKTTKSAATLLYGREYDLEEAKSKTASAKQGKKSPSSKTQRQPSSKTSSSSRVDVISLQESKKGSLPLVNQKQSKQKHAVKKQPRPRPTTAPAPKKQPQQHRELSKPNQPQTQRRGLSASTKAQLQFDPEPVEALAQIALREKPELVPVSILAQINKEKKREKELQRQATKKSRQTRPRTAGPAPCDESKEKDAETQAATPLARSTHANSKDEDACGDEALEPIEGTASQAKPKFSTISLNNSRRAFKQKLRDSLADGLVKMCGIHSRLLHEAAKKEETLRGLCSQMEDLLVLAGDRNESNFVGVDAGIVRRRQELLKAGKEISAKLKQVEIDHVAIQKRLRHMEDTHVVHKSELRDEEESVDQVITERKELAKLLAQLVDLNKRTHAKLTSKMSAFILRKEKIDAALQERRIQVGLHNEKIKMEEKISKGLEKWDNDLDNGVGVSSPPLDSCMGSRGLLDQVVSVLSIDVDADKRRIDVDTPHRPEPLHSPKFQAKLRQMAAIESNSQMGQEAFPLDAKNATPEELEARQADLKARKRNLQVALANASVLSLVGEVLQIANTPADAPEDEGSRDEESSDEKVLRAIDSALEAIVSQVKETGKVAADRVAVEGITSTEAESATENTCGPPPEAEKFSPVETATAQDDDDTSGYPNPASASVSASASSLSSLTTPKSAETKEDASKTDSEVDEKASIEKSDSDAIKEMADEEKECVSTESKSSQEKLKQEQDKNSKQAENASDTIASDLVADAISASVEQAEERVADIGQTASGTVKRAISEALSRVSSSASLVSREDAPP